MFSSRRATWVVRVVGSLCLCTLLAANGAADDAEKYKQLETQFTELHNAGKLAEAEKVAREVHELLRTRFPKERQLQVQWLNKIGVKCIDQGKYDVAEAVLKQALTQAEHAVGAEALDTGNIQYNLGMVYVNLQKYEDANTHYWAAFEIYRKNHGQNHADVASAALKLGDLWWKMDKMADARTAFETALQIRREICKEDDPFLAQAYYYLGQLNYADGRYADAEGNFDQALAVYIKARPEGDTDVINSANRLAEAYIAQGKYQDSEKLYKALIELQGKKHGTESAEVALVNYSLGKMYKSAGTYDQACETLEHALELYTAIREPVNYDIANSHYQLADGLESKRDLPTAIEHYQKALELYAQLSGEESADVEVVLCAISRCKCSQGNFDDAEKFALQAVEIAEKLYPEDSPKSEATLRTLTNAYYRQTRYAEAQPILEKLLRVLEKSYSADAPIIASTCHDLGSVYHGLNRYVEAERLYRRAIDIRTKAYGPDDVSVAQTSMFLASMQRNLGRFADAEQTMKRTVAIFEKAYGPNDSRTAIALYELAEVFDRQGNYAASKPLYRRVLNIREQVLGPDHPEVGTSLLRIAEATADPKEALEIYMRSLDVLEKALGPDHNDVSMCLSSIGNFFVDRGQYAEAAPYLERSLAIEEKKYGPSHPETADVLYDLAVLEYRLQKYAESEKLIDRVIAIRERNAVGPKARFYSYDLRALVLWELGEKQEAIGDLRMAMELAEEQREMVAGAEQDRARVFGQMSFVFERMVNWQTAMGEQCDITEVFKAMERYRAQSLRDEMVFSSINFDADSSTRQQELDQQTAELKGRISEIERQLADASASEDGSAKGQADREALMGQLAEARENLYQFYRDSRGSNASYQGAFEVIGAEPVTLRVAERNLVGDDSVLLSYLVGNTGSYVVAISPDESRSLALKVDEESAKALSIDAGPLTFTRLQNALAGTDGNGILSSLADPVKAMTITPQLAALWKVLIPEELRELITGAGIKRLLIVPDGPLAMVPFEALVVEPGNDPKYLIDIGPAITYGPSATALCELLDRIVEPVSSDREPVLTVGDPTYEAGGAAFVAGQQGGGDSSRFGLVGGSLAPLPYSGQESQWVADAFKKFGSEATRLVGDEATEKAIRELIAGRRVIHLACHGMTDQQYGNLFGTLALTPGDKSSPSDDGFLMLAEIYGLDLKSCELAVLSACQTNYGPQQKGEGVWALSRGFLVAGARRVVASNWIVDDEAAASLVSYFCGGVAGAEENADPDSIEYAASLHAAKKYIRSQKKWSSPYYWAPFVMVGPN